MKGLFLYTVGSLHALIKRQFNFVLKPRFINFVLTYKCNARCIMCDIWNLYKRHPQKQAQELSLEDLKEFLNKNRDFLSNLTHVGFTGGDPLLMRKDFVDIVRLFREILPGVNLGVQTNGLLPELARDKLAEIINFYPNFSLAVSLDGISHTHAKIRGIEGAFEKALKTVDYARELGIKRITSGLTITEHNYDQICEVKDLTEGRGCEFSCFLAERADYFNNSDSQSQNSLTEQQRQSVISQLKSSARGHYYMDNLRLELEGRRKLNHFCFSGFTSLVIDPYGNLKPCILKVKGVADDVFGNIKTSSLSAILNSTAAFKIRKAIKKCNCWCQCEVSSSSVVYPGDVLWWYLFYCRDRKEFLKKLSPKFKLFHIGGKDS